jgi:Spy/CpxP family protein refolding chaperone
MKTLTKRKAICYLVAIFLVGAATGAGGHTSGKHRKFGPPPHSEDMARHIGDTLKGRLELSADQMTKIVPIIQQACGEVQGIHRDSGKRVSQIFQDMNQRMAEYLTPEQRVKLDELERERQESWRKRMRPSGKPPRPPGTSPGSNCPPGASKV